ncbi:MAG TPA: helix-turn-helix domain-containing protein [Dongiaceae bacterium]|nr:helix-turn-helix domain-containing protein [Dongiaceae bacterium]
MKFLEMIKKLGLLDIVVLAMLEMGYGVSDIAANAQLSRQTVYDIKNRNKELTERLKTPN